MPLIYFHLYIARIILYSSIPDFVTQPFKIALVRNFRFLFPVINL